MQVISSQRFHVAWNLLLYVVGELYGSRFILRFVVFQVDA